MVEQVVVEVFVHEQQHNDFDELDVLGRVDVRDYLPLAGPEQNASRGRTQRTRTQGQGCSQGAHLANSPFISGDMFSPGILMNLPKRSHAYPIDCGP